MKAEQHSASAFERHGFQLSRSEHNTFPSTEYSSTVVFDQSFFHQESRRVLTASGRLMDGCVPSDREFLPQMAVA